MSAALHLLPSFHKKVKYQSGFPLIIRPNNPPPNPVLQNQVQVLKGGKYEDHKPTPDSGGTDGVDHAPNSPDCVRYFYHIGIN